MKYLIPLVLLVTIAGCSDSDMEYECSEFTDTYYMTLSADKMVLTQTHSWGVVTFYYALGTETELGGFRTYKDFDNGSVLFRTKDESFLGCERIK